VAGIWASSEHVFWMCLFRTYASNLTFRGFAQYFHISLEENKLKLKLTPNFKLIMNLLCTILFCTV
jgi:hypothetical protein